jgi:hypothetical protein
MVYFHGIADFPNGTSIPWRIYKEYVLLFLGVLKQIQDNASVLDMISVI